MGLQDGGGELGFVGWGAWVCRRVEVGFAGRGGGELGFVGWGAWVCRRVEVGFARGFLYLQERGCKTSNDYIHRLLGHGPPRKCFKYSINFWHISSTVKYWMYGNHQN